MNSWKKSYFFWAGMFVLVFSHNSFALSVKMIGEYERIDLSDSILNSDNVLERPADRIETAALFEDAYDLGSGELAAAFRADIQYLSWLVLSPDLAIKGQFNELFYQREAGNLTMTLGRKKIRWGVGYAMSPTDIITQLREAQDPEDRFQLREGTDLLQISATAGDSNFDLVYFPSIQQRLGFRYYRYRELLDVSIVGKIEESGKWAAGVNGSLALGSALELHGEYLFSYLNDTFYPDFVNNPGTLLSFPYSQKGNPVQDLLIGGQYTFGNYWNLTVEYIYRGRGYSDAEWDAYANHPPDASVFMPPMRQHYLFLRLFKGEIFPSVSFEWPSFIGLSDLSGFQALQVKYTGSDGFNPYFRLQRFWGGSSSEFGLVPEAFETILGIAIFFET